MPHELVTSTKDGDYAKRLLDIESVGWKKFVRPIDPYKWHIRFLDLGVTLDIGCGLGRNLKLLPPGSIGIDHNEECVRHCLNAGLKAATPKEFLKMRRPSEGFDSLLLSHVAEHMTFGEALALTKEYAAYVKEGGRLLLITPQEKGWDSDATHVEFMGFDKLRAIAEAAGFSPLKTYSFPFPRAVGRFFIYNEFIAISEKRGRG